MASSTLFGTVDYVVFFLILCVSSSIGVYFCVVGRKRQSMTEYLLAGKRSKVIPVACSILASIVSAIGLMGFPVETYLYGAYFSLIAPGHLLGGLVAGVVFLPIFHQLKLTSINEYLGLRFGRKVALCGAVAYILQMELYLTVVLYAPALALSTVTGVSLEMCVLTVGLVCTMYTTIGGMNAVIWTDVFQASMMLAGVLAVLIKGLMESGGVSGVWEAAYRGKRVGFLDFDVSPVKRTTFWSTFFGGFFLPLVAFSVNQTQVQRYLTQPTLRGARITLGISCIAVTIFVVLTSLCGLVIYAKYEQCDPYTAGYIDKPDQILPYFVMDTLSFLPGLPGIFVSSILCATMSSLSSAFNSFAAIIMQDMLVPVTNMSEARRTLGCKIISLVFGLATTGGAFVVGSSATIAQVALGFYAAVGGPILGMFTAGMLVPSVNAKGAVTGLITGLAVTLWVILGALVTEPDKHILDLSVVGCDVGSSKTTYSTTLTTNITTIASDLCEHTDTSLRDTLYSISFLWYSVLGSVTTLVTAILASWYTGCQDPSTLDPRTIFPPCRRFSPLPCNPSNKEPRSVTLHGDMSKEESEIDIDGHLELDDVTIKNIGFSEGQSSALI